jgi:hypothetical protein
MTRTTSSSFPGAPPGHGRLLRRFGATVVSTVGAVAPRRLMRETRMTRTTSSSFPGAPTRGMANCSEDLRGIGVLADKGPPLSRARRACHAGYLHRFRVPPRGMRDCSWSPAPIRTCQQRTTTRPWTWPNGPAIRRRPNCFARMGPTSSYPARKQTGAVSPVPISRLLFRSSRLTAVCQCRAAATCCCHFLGLMKPWLPLNGNS